MSSDTRAIILAAGRGDRLRPLTDDRPKCLVSFKGRPILEHTLEALAVCGVDDVTLVTGYRAEALEPYGLPTRHNPDFETTNMVHSLFCAEDCMDRDFLIVYGDIVWHPRLVTALLEDPAELAITVDRKWRDLWQRRFEDPLSDAETLLLVDAGRLLEIGNKPDSYDEIEAQYMGLMKVAGAGVDRFKRFYHGLDHDELYQGRAFHNMHMTSLIATMIARDVPVHATCVDGGWVEIDSGEDLEVCEAMPAEWFEGP